MAAVTLALTTAGCSFSYKLDSLFEKNKQASGETTGAVAEKAATALAMASDGDLAYARAAASEVLRRGGNGVSQPWENPETGARGTVTPIASVYDLDGFTCQDFLQAMCASAAAKTGCAARLAAFTRAIGKCAA